MFQFTHHLHHQKPPSLPLSASSLPLLASVSTFLYISACFPSISLLSTTKISPFTSHATYWLSLSLLSYTHLPFSLSCYSASTSPETSSFHFLPYSSKLKPLKQLSSVIALPLSSPSLLHYRVPMTLPSSLSLLLPPDLSQHSINVHTPSSFFNFTFSIFHTLSF